MNKKTKQGALNVVTEVLADPKVQGAIKNALLRETIKNTIIMSCLLIGLLKLYEVIKTVTGFDWRGDLCISIVLVFVGLIYTVKSMYYGKKNGDAEANSSSPSSS